MFLTDSLGDGGNGFSGLWETLLSLRRDPDDHDHPGRQPSKPAMGYSARVGASFTTLAHRDQFGQRVTISNLHETELHQLSIANGRECDREKRGFCKKLEYMVKLFLQQMMHPRKPSRSGRVDQGSRCKTVDIYTSGYVLCELRRSTGSSVCAVERDACKTGFSMECGEDSLLITWIDMRSYELASQPDQSDRDGSQHRRVRGVISYRPLDRRRQPTVILAVKSDSPFPPSKKSCIGPIANSSCLFGAGEM